MAREYHGVIVKTDGTLLRDRTQRARLVVGCFASMATRSVAAARRVPSDGGSPRGTGMGLAFYLLPVAAALHVLEEWRGGFIAQINQVLSGVTAAQFWVINAAFLGLCIVAAAVHRSHPVFALSAIALVGINALVHLVTTLVLGTYSPGLISALLVYVPLTIWTYKMALATKVITRSQACRAALLGLGILLVPLLVQGLRIALQL